MSGDYSLEKIDFRQMPDDTLYCCRDEYAL